MNNSITVTLTELCNHHQYLPLFSPRAPTFFVCIIQIYYTHGTQSLYMAKYGNFRYFHYSEKKLCPFKSLPLTTSSLKQQPLAPWCLHLCWTIIAMEPCIWLLCLASFTQTVFSKFIHLVVCISTSFLFIAN